jgi:DNA (cytosine-5)-methyltransferase 1
MLMLGANMYTVDLFAGCGGLSLGFAQAGFRIVAAYDSWERALECYRANLPHPTFFLNLSDVERARAHIARFAPRVVVGGPPCQDFSHAGPREEKSRADLTVDFARIVAGLRPLAFVMENVDRTPRSKAYKEARRLLVEAGYGLTETTLDASLCGVPQRRKRFFSIGVLGVEDGFLLPLLEAGLAERPLTVRAHMGYEIDFDYYYRHPRNYNRRGVYSVDEPAPTVRGVNRPMPRGYKGHPQDPVPPGPGVRALTTEERARIQTFPRDWTWVGTKTEVEQMIGNAVPPALAKFVGKALMAYLRLPPAG